MTFVERLRAIDPAARTRLLRWAVWLACGSLLFNLILGDMGIVAGLRQRHAAARLRAEVTALQAANDALAGDVRALNADPFRIEALAREELGLARPGEIVFVFPPAPDARPSASSGDPDGR